MSIIAVGVNHKTAPISVLERLAIGPEQHVKALHQLANYEHILEGAVLSTCNRIEVYALASRFHAGVQDLRNFLSEYCHVPPEDFADHLYTYHDDGAVRHLFRVAAGIDSMVIGESEILGQVRRAYQAAQEEGMVPRVLGAAFRQALRVGKRARSETAIGRNPVSVSSAAVDLAKRAFGGDTLKGKRVAVVGAGKMGRLAARALTNSGVSDVTVVNRSEERAQELAEMFHVSAVPFERLPSVIAAADILISSTTAPQTIIERSTVERAVAERTGTPLFIVDIAVPRDVEPSVAEVPGVVLRDIDDLRGVVEASVGSRLSEVGKVEEVIAAEVDRFVEWERATEIGPTITSLISKAETIREEELARLRARFATLDPDQRAAVDQLVSRIIAKLLHVPINKAKELASSKQGYLYLAALRELFELDNEPDP
ncbi:MAG: glutamyl-tRNA reductase [Actinomycetota bacterium]|nr:glutamyl-tRNA reductase [Actinomycetota bacterium]